jgi:phosphatidylserine decarboxylase
MMKIAPGWVEGFMMSAPVAIVGGGGVVFLAAPWSWIAGGVMLILSLAILFFFRDPERTPLGGEECVVAAADGLVTDVEEVVSEELGNTKVWRVSVFLSVLDVHVNRVPLSGRVVEVRRVGGLFLDARNGSSAMRNARMDWLIETMWGRVVVRQITGLIARRIVAWVHEGDEVSRGDRLGMIRFGSRTDVLFPLSWVVAVKVGERVRGGETIIARAKVA